jgi:hypothetical protein
MPKEAFDSASEEPIMKVPAGMGANFIPMEFVKTSSARAELATKPNPITTTNMKIIAFFIIVISFFLNLNAKFEIKSARVFEKFLHLVSVIIVRLWTTKHHLKAFL